MTYGTKVLDDQFGQCWQCVKNQSLVMVQSTIVLRVGDATIRIMAASIRLLLHDAVDVSLKFGQGMNDDLKKRSVKTATEYVLMIANLCRGLT